MRVKAGNQLSQDVQTLDFGSGFSLTETNGDVAVANGGDSSFIGLANGSDDTATIQALLTAGGNIKGTRGQSYIISSPLVVKSNTDLDLTGCTVTLKASSNCHMFESPGVADASRSHDITIEGGTWDRGANGGSGNNLHAAIFRNVDRLEIKNVKAKSTAGKIAINVAGCTDFLVEGCTSLDFTGGFIQITGGCRHGAVRRIRGNATDDLVAVIPRDWVAYSFGDETDPYDITIEDIKADTQKCLVKVLGGSGLNTKRIFVRDVSGTAQTTPVWIGDDTGEAATIGGLLDDISLEDIAVSCPSNNSQILVTGTNLKRITLDGWHYEVGAATTQPGMTVGTSATTSVDTLEVSRVTFADGCANQGLIAVKGQINNLVVDGVGGTPAASSHLIKLDDTVAGAKTLRVSIANLGAAWATVSGSVFKCNNTGHTVNDVSLANCDVSNVANLIDAGTTFNLHLSNVVTDQAAVFCRATGNVTAYVSGSCKLGSNAVTAGGSLAWPPLKLAIVNPVYSTSITPNAIGSEWQTITVTDGVAFTVNAPTNPPSSAYTQRLNIEVLNSAGGAMGAITWNSAFVFNGFTWANPASTKKRFAAFQWNGTKWVCVGIAGADY